MYNFLSKEMGSMLSYPVVAFGFYLLLGILSITSVFPSLCFGYQHVNNRYPDPITDDTSPNPSDLFERAFVDQFADKQAALKGWQEGGGKIFKQYYKMVYPTNSIQIFTERLPDVIKKAISERPNADPYILSFMALNSFYPRAEWGSPRGTAILTGAKKEDSSSLFVFTKDSIGNPLSIYTEISQNPLSYEIIQDRNILRIRLNSIIPKQSLQIIERLAKENDGPIVLDFRGSNGGFLSEIRKILSVFNAGGRELFKTQSANATNPTRYFSSRHPDLVAKNPLMVLFDQETAVGSLLMVAALQDQKRAFVGGIPIKDVIGFYNTTLPLPNDFCPQKDEKCALQIPTGELIRPSGIPLSDGINPDISLDWSDPMALNKAISAWLDEHK
ncbi:MAG: hypothetical protein H6912_01610 [Kordiimonadaceae bacterium]|nr:hypothetical protein [Kordiimonadaceae bacterium]